MFEIYFSNTITEHNQDTRMCSAPTFEIAMNVFDALCKQYLHVTVYCTSSGSVIRKYCNIYPD